MFKAENKDTRTARYRTTKSNTLMCFATNIAYTGKREHGKEMSNSFEGNAKCFSIILDLDSLYVETFDKIWKRVGLVSSPNSTWDF